jgi:transcription antitermination factor NusG
MQHHYWTVLKTKDTASQEARRHIESCGFETYHPMFRAKPKRGVRKDVPLFPFYLIVKVNEQWRSLSSMRGVSKIFMAGAKPAKIADEDVQRFRDLEDELGYYVMPETEPPKFQMKQPVVVQEGWMRGCSGVYHGIAGTSRERVKVLFSILGVPQVLEMSAYDIA